MTKKRLPVLFVIAGVFLLTSCVKKVKDLAEDIEQSAQCAQLLSNLSTNGEDRPCSEQIADINKILNDCGPFLTEEQKDDLNFAKDNCTDD